MLFNLKFATFICVLFFLEIRFYNAEEDLYSVLGVEPSASARTIKQAYKSLAKVWHPDKNNEPDANDKFMKINQAYETLSDPQKRESYDRFGTINGPGSMDQGFDGFASPFDHFFENDHFGGFKTNNRINLWTFEREIYPKSMKKPFFVYAYVNFCLQCVRVWPIWEKFTQDLEKLGLGFGTLDVNSDPMLRQKLKVRSIPTVVLVIDKRIVHFSSSSFSVKELRDFLRSVYPAGLVKEVNEKDVDEFTRDFWNNKLKVLMVDWRSSACLRFMASAHSFLHNVHATHLNIKKLPLNSPLWRKYGLSSDKETLVLLKDDNSTRSISASWLSRQQIDNVLQESLVAPKIDCMSTFHNVCPFKRHCVLLLLRDKSDKAFLDSFVASASKLDSGMFAYVLQNTQSAFVAALSKDTGVELSESRRKMIGIWRKSEKQWKYEWKEDGWIADGDDLDTWLRVLKGGKMQSTLVFKQVPIVDESSEGFLSSIWRRFSEYIDVDFLSIFDSYLDSPTTTIVMAVTFFCFLAVLMSSFKSSSSLDTTLEQLDTQSYEDRVLNARSGGWRLVVLLVPESWTNERKRHLLEYFSYATQTYTSPHFRFRFMYTRMTPERQKWFSTTFKEAFDTKKNISVVALNPTLKYYHFFVSSPEHFLDLRDDISELELWMDKLYEGNCPKLYLTSWPEFFP